MKLKKIAIMGANGFIGKNLSEFLQERYETYPITRDKFNLLDSKEVKKFFEMNKIDIVINCSNVGGIRKNGYQENNDIVKNNLKLFFNLESCLLPQMKLINFGSGAQYNKNRDLVKVSEDEIGRDIPEDYYGYSKYVMSKYINKCTNIYNPIIFGLFGKYEDYSFRFISNAIIKNILNMPIIINQNVLFDYLYIDDFLNIIELLIENNFKDKEFNITPTESIDLVSVAEYINTCSAYQSEIIIRNKEMNYQYTGSNEKMVKNMGKYPFLCYNDSIQRLYDYYRKNLSTIDIESLRNDKALDYCKSKDLKMKR